MNTFACKTHLLRLVLFHKHWLNDRPHILNAATCHIRCGTLHFSVASQAYMKLSTCTGQSLPSSQCLFAMRRAMAPACAIICPSTTSTGSWPIGVAERRFFLLEETMKRAHLAWFSSIPRLVRACPRSRLSCGATCNESPHHVRSDWSKWVEACPSVFECFLVDFARETAENNAWKDKRNASVTKITLHCGTLTMLLR